MSRTHQRDTKHTRMNLYTGTEEQDGEIAWEQVRSKRSGKKDLVRDAVREDQPERKEAQSANRMPLTSKKGPGHGLLPKLFEQQALQKFYDTWLPASFKGGGDVRKSVPFEDFLKFYMVYAMPARHKYRYDMRNVVDPEFPKQVLAIHPYKLRRDTLLRYSPPPTHILSKGDRERYAATVRDYTNVGAKNGAASSKGYNGRVIVHERGLEKQKRGVLLQHECPVNMHGKQYRILVRSQQTPIAAKRTGGVNFTLDGRVKADAVEQPKAPSKPVKKVSVPVVAVSIPAPPVDVVNEAPIKQLNSRQRRDAARKASVVVQQRATQYRRSLGLSALGEGSHERVHDALRVLAEEARTAVEVKALKGARLAEMQAALSDLESAGVISGSGHMEDAYTKVGRANIQKRVDQREKEQQLKYFREEDLPATPDMRKCLYKYTELDDARPFARTFKVLYYEWKTRLIVGEHRTFEAFLNGQHGEATNGDDVEYVVIDRDLILGIGEALKKAKCYGNNMRLVNRYDHAFRYCCALLKNSYNQRVTITAEQAANAGLGVYLKGLEPTGAPAKQKWDDDASGMGLAGGGGPHVSPTPSVRSISSFSARPPHRQTSQQPPDPTRSTMESDDESTDADSIAMETVVSDLASTYDDFREEMKPEDDGMREYFAERGYDLDADGLRKAKAFACKYADGESVRLYAHAVPYTPHSFLAAALRGFAAGRRKYLLVKWAVPFAFGATMLPYLVNERVEVVPERIERLVSFARQFSSQDSIGGSVARWYLGRLRANAEIVQRLRLSVPTIDEPNVLKKWRASAEVRRPYTVKYVASVALGAIVLVAGAYFCHRAYAFMHQPAPLEPVSFFEGSNVIEDDSAVGVPAPPWFRAAYEECAGEAFSDSLDTYLSRTGFTRLIPARINRAMVHDMLLDFPGVTMSTNTPDRYSSRFLHKHDSEPALQTGLVPLALVHASAQAAHQVSLLQMLRNQRTTVGGGVKIFPQSN